MFNATILTLYPEMFPSVLGEALLGRAMRDGLWQLDITNIRDFAVDKHKKVDDTPYGGGAGLVMKPDIVSQAIDFTAKKQPNNKLIYLSPQGQPLTQKLAKELATEQGLTMLCGRFEGVDERVLEHYQPLEVSIGDYILFGGEVAAMVVLEATLRNLQGVLGNGDTLHEESFDFGENSALLLEYPHYTKPPFWNGREVPEVLKNGNHQEIANWRKQKAEEVTKIKRPDLWQKYSDKS